MIRAWLCRQLGVDQMVKDAFYEGFKFAGSIDPLRCKNLGVPLEAAKALIVKTSSWRSVDEAWANSDAEERFK
jgi:hypothetical protein